MRITEDNRGVWTVKDSDVAGFGDSEREAQWRFQLLKDTAERRRTPFAKPDSAAEATNHKRNRRRGQRKVWQEPNPFMELATTSVSQKEELRNG
jgi:hypothetical protein